MKRHFVLISYDISDPKRLRRVAKQMESYGRRVQKSVFECWLTQRQHLDLKNRLGRMIDHETDSIRIYQLCRTCVSAVEWMGIGSFGEDGEIVVI